MERFILLLLLAATGCSKKDEVAPEVSINAPAMNEVFSAGQTVTIRATVSDNEGIHMIHVTAIDNTGGHWVHSEDHVDGKTFQVTKSFIANAGKNFTITVSGTDHSENTTTKEITVTSN